MTGVRRSPALPLLALATVTAPDGSVTRVSRRVTVRR